MERDGREILCEECGRLEDLDKFGTQVCLFKVGISPKNKVNGCQHFQGKMENGFPLRWIPIGVRKAND